MKTLQQGVDEAAEAARDARTKSRRKQLLAAAARLMEDRGSQEVSMQSVADAAGVSVGLIYRYFGNKQDLVQAVIVGVLEEFSNRVGAAVTEVEDPVRQIAAAFKGYCDVIDENRDGTILAYRDTKTLDAAGRSIVKELELTTGKLLSKAVRDAADAGLIRPVDYRIFAFQLLMTAHSWALKHWYFSRHFSHEDFIAHHTALALSGVLRPETRAQYSDLLGDLA